MTLVDDEPDPRWLLRQDVHHALKTLAARSLV